MKEHKKKVLYVFGGEHASGAEYVIERLIQHNSFCDSVLLMSTGSFANKLAQKEKRYKLIQNENLKKLQRSNNSKTKVLIRLIKQLIQINCFVFKLIKTEKPQLVHCNTIVPSMYLLPSLLLTKITHRKIKWIWSDHDLKYTKVPLLNTVCKILPIFFNGTLAVSEAVKLKYKNSKQNIFVLYNGLNLSDIKINNSEKTAFKKQLNIEENALVFGIMGHIIPRKGVLALCETFSKTFKNDNQYLVVAGHEVADAKAYFEAFETLCNTHTNIIYVGFLNNINAFYNGIDVLINNSSKLGEEPLGTTILEGLAYNKIVLASHVGGSKEIINQGVNGYLFEPDNPESLQHSLEKVKQLSAQQRLEITRNARTTIEEKFEINIMVKNYNTIVNKL